MAAFTVTGYKSPGQTFTVTNATAPSDTDTIKLNGVKQTLANWKKCGIFKFKSTDSTTHTYYLEGQPEVVGQMAG